MKIKSLEIKNIGIIQSEIIQFNKPLNLFYGAVMTGKTTVLNSIKLCFGGSFSQSIIHSGEKKASVKLSFDDSIIKREFYVSKDGSTKAKSIEFFKSGMPVSKPIDAIKELLNPFLLDQDHLIDMSELERKKYFIKLFGASTEDLDNEYVRIEQQARELRAEIKGFGDIDTVEISQVNLQKLVGTKSNILKDHENSKLLIEDENEKRQKINMLIQNAKDKIDEYTKKIQYLEKEINLAGQDISKNEVQDFLPIPEIPDTIEIDNKITLAIQTNVKYDQYVKDKERIKQKEQKEIELDNLTSNMQDIKLKKISKLESISETCNVEGLKFNSNGDFTYENTAAGMLSTSQIMRLSSELSKLYPDGFGLELVDKAESLGTSIFTFIENAKQNNKTILATIVGNRPAEIPEEIGVFIVKDGNIEKSN